MAFRVKLWHLALSGGFAIGTLALCISFLSVVKEVEAFDRPRVAFAIPKEKNKKSCSCKWYDYVGVFATSGPKSCRPNRVRYRFRG